MDEITKLRLQQERDKERLAKLVKKISQQENKIRELCPHVRLRYEEGYFNPEGDWENGSIACMDCGLYVLDSEDRFDTLYAQYTRTLEDIVNSVY